MTQLLPNLRDVLISISPRMGMVATVNPTHTRDEGLSRVSSITRWVAALGVAATGVLAAVVYKEAPGRSAASPSSVTSGGTSTSDPGTDDGGFQAPQQAPAPVQQAPVVRSGAS
jgi:hypothetical protein